MYHFNLRKAFIALLLFSFSCGQQLPTLEGIDLLQWKEDRNGCNGKRLVMMQALDTEKEKLKKLSEMDLVKLLGRPDENVLLDRNQKIYIYYLSPGPACDQPSDNANKLELRINAMGLTKETLIR